MTKAKGKILIVEDEPDLRDVYALILQHAGYETSFAVNGIDGLDQVKAFNPRLVLLDIFMPVMDGKKFLESLDHSKYPDMKIIVCSNTSDQRLMDDMKRIGADDVVIKSKLAPADLINLVLPYMNSKS